MLHSFRQNQHEWQPTLCVSSGRARIFCADIYSKDRRAGISAANAAATIHVPTKARLGERALPGAGALSLSELPQHETLGKRF